MSEESKNNITKENTLRFGSGQLPRFTSLLAACLLVVIVVYFFNGTFLRFYASALFAFYALTNSIWISVVLLGVFQTALMVPLRVIRIKKSSNIDEFQKYIKKVSASKEQHFLIKKNFREGNRTFLFYAVDFMIQLTTFMTIGRLFLKDFYNTPLDQSLLYSIVPYPEYPINDTFFKLPYVAFTETTQLGMVAILIAWFTLLLVKLLSILSKKIAVDLPDQSENAGFKIAKKIFSFSGSRIVLLMIVVWFLFQNFPVSWEFRVFTGDVGLPNRTFNSLTATMTFITLMWFGMQKIKRKTKLAENRNVDPKAIQLTQRSMFKETLMSSCFVGLGAFYITNQIPCAFELSIFTFEVISMLSPLTLDKAIMATNKLPMQAKV